MKKTAKKKVKKSYLTLVNGRNYRAIAKLLSTHEKTSINHSSVRNITVSSTYKLLKGICEELNSPITEEELFQILQTNQIYELLRLVLQEAYLN